MIGSYTKLADYRFPRQRTGLEPLERSPAPIRTWRPILMPLAGASALGLLWSLL